MILKNYRVYQSAEFFATDNKLVIATLWFHVRSQRLPRCHVLDGPEEKPNESWEETQEKVQRLLQEKLNLEQVELEHAHRVGPSFMQKISRPCIVVLRFARFADRQQALRNSPMLRNTNIYINEDLCETSLQLWKTQTPELKKARAEGKIAYFNHTKLIIRGRGIQRSGLSKMMAQPDGSFETAAQRGGSSESAVGHSQTVPSLKLRSTGTFGASVDGGARVVQTQSDGGQRTGTVEEQKNKQESRVT